MGAAASFIWLGRREALRFAVHEILPVNIYPLEERRFPKGSLYDSDESFAAQCTHVPVFEALGLHEWSVSQLWRLFRQMNKTGSGDVTLWEFREYFDLPDDRSTTRLFRCFDEDRDNRIGFAEFVVGLWTYCCNCHASLMCFSFDLYDTDHNGTISLEEAGFMIEDVFGRGWESDVIGRATHDWVHGREAAKFGSPELSVDDWSTFMLANLSVVAAVVRTRLVLQTKMIGVGFWNHCLTKNIMIYAGRRATVEQLLSAHISQDALEMLANDRNPEVDHNDTTQLNLKVLRRTGPFPRRRKYRDMKGKTLAVKTEAKFKLLSVRETFERLAVPPGADASWEEPKAPSALQALMATFPSAQDRCPVDRGRKSAPAPVNDLRAEENRMRAAISKQNKASSIRMATDGPPESLALLTARPGIDSTPLGSPSTTSARSGSSEPAIDDDPVIANAFKWLKTLPDSSQGEGSSRACGGGRRNKKSTKKGMSYRDGLSTQGQRKTSSDGGNSERPSTAGMRPKVAAGVGKVALSRTGRDLVLSRELRPVGNGGEGCGSGGEGALSARLFQ